MPVLLSLFASHAVAAEVQFDGYYRARLRGLDAVVLDRSLSLNGGPTFVGQHRLWLAPKFLLTDQVGVFVQLRGFNNLPFGSEPAAPFSDVENAVDYDLQPPTGEDTDPLFDISLWRAWAEVYTDYGQFTFGRAPLKWGTGVWLNDGLTIDPLFADYGDTTDRLMWEYLVQNQFYLRLSVDTVAERLFDGTNDDTTAVGIGLAYRTEGINAGITAQLDHTGDEAEDILTGDVFTADAAADVTLGRLHVAAEVVGQFGGGTLGGSEVSVAAVGAALDATMEIEKYRLSARGGFASGDETNDTQLRSFTFDRDFSVGLFMFEQPLLTVGLETPSNVSSDPVQMAGAISNALFLKPKISRQIVDGLWVDASWLGARTARGPTTAAGVKTSSSYGNEVQLGASYTAIQHLTVDGRLGAFLPGTAYTRTPIGAETGFDRPVFGFQLTGMVQF